MSTLRILLADDHIVVRQGLRKILEDHANWHVVAEAADGHEAVRQAEEHKPAVAVLDTAPRKLCFMRSSAASFVSGSSRRMP